MALSSYTNINVNGDPVVVNSIDSATGSMPAERPSTFTPVNGFPTLTVGTDSGVGSTPMKRIQTCEPVSFSCTLDPGLTVNG